MFQESFTRMKQEKAKVERIRVKGLDHKAKG